MVNQLENLHPNQVIDQVLYLPDFQVGFQLDNPAPTPVHIRQTNQVINLLLNLLRFLPPFQVVNQLVTHQQILVISQRLSLPVYPLHYPRPNRVPFQLHHRRAYHQELLRISPLLRHHLSHRINRQRILQSNQLLFQARTHHLFRVVNLQIFQLLCHLLFRRTFHLLPLPASRRDYQVPNLLNSRCRCRA